MFWSNTFAPQIAGKFPTADMKFEKNFGKENNVHIEKAANPAESLGKVGIHFCPLIHCFYLQML